jgi:hypothetical protein
MKIEILHAMAKLLECMGEPFPHVDKCLESGQSPVDLERTMAEVIVDCLEFALMES